MPGSNEKNPGRARVIPGTRAIEGVEVLYYAEDGRSTADDLFDAITGYVQPRNARFGGTSPYGCELTLPGGSRFHAVGFHGDLNGWRKDIEEGSRGLGLPLARIAGDRVVVSDGREFRLADCKPRFY
ncbi:MAG TPA: hypothetical protein VGF24_28505 [Vicinamibacterales bacterium]|jgi:hypothetical protein